MIRAALALFLFMAAPSYAVTCQDITYQRNDYTICEVDPAQDELRLFLYAESGTPYAQFATLDQALAEDGKRLAFAMNAGMYHADRAPVGYYLEDRQEKMRVVENASPGNFGLLPNGVFCIGNDRAQVFETTQFLSETPDCDHATQSGPMLVINGALHPRFLPDSTSRYIRNGVGANADGTRVVFAISNNAVTFHEFGRLFLDHLSLPQALYFDGNISKIYAPHVNRADIGRPMGPIVGIVQELSD
ncbi:MAG: phosphodiester glycosidase family protein [Pseudomonadota bacterium]